MTKKHSWTWNRTWRLWQKPARKCLKCGGLLRLSPGGPRGGKRYFFRDPYERDYRQVAYLPPCFGPEPQEEKPREEIASATKLLEPPR